MKNGKKFNKWSIIFRLNPFLAPYKLRIIIGIIFGFLYGVTSIGLPLVAGWVVGLVSNESFSISTIQLTNIENNSLTNTQLIKSLLILPGFALLQGIIFYIGKYMIEWSGSKMVTDLREKLFSHIHSLPIEFFSHNKSGQLISRITTDTGAISFLVSNVLSDIIRAPFTLIGSIAVLFFINWKLSIIALSILPICIIPILKISKKIRIASAKNQQSIGELLSVSQETISAAMIVKAYQTEKFEKNNFNKHNDTIFKMTMKQIKGISLSEPLMTFVSSIGISIIFIYIYYAQLPIALLAAFITALANMYKPLKKISMLHIKINKSIPSIERIFYIFDQKNTILNNSNPIFLSEKIRDIEFKNVSFKYNDEENILKDISFKSNAGQCTAIVGGSGSGKTTLINLIPRFYDICNGEILINGININQFDIDSLRSNIGIVTQNTVLFNQSIKYNIAYGSPNATEDKIIEVSKKANAHGFISEMKNEYDTVIGEQGALLSGGMAQRISIARALLRNPPILILDEATSSLDNESERLVQSALNELMKNRTVFVIAHRLSTIKNSDRIIVLEDGIITETGKHEELISFNKQYKYLHDLQFKD